MFSENDLVFYPAQGVGKIEHIQREELGGGSFLAYIVKIRSNGATLLVPVDNAGKVGLRALVEPETAQAVLDGLRQDTVGTIPSGQNWNRRFRENTERLKHADIKDLASVLQSLLQQGKTKELSFGERRLQDQAMELVLGELSLVLDIPEQDIRQDLLLRYANASKEKPEGSAGAATGSALHPA